MPHTPNTTPHHTTHTPHTSLNCSVGSHTSKRLRNTSTVAQLRALTVPKVSRQCPRRRWRRQRWRHPLTHTQSPAQSPVGSAQGEVACSVCSLSFISVFVTVFILSIAPPPLPLSYAAQSRQFSIEFWQTTDIHQCQPPVRAPSFAAPAPYAPIRHEKRTEREGEGSRTRATLAVPTNQRRIPGIVSVISGASGAH